MRINSVGTLLLAFLLSTSVANAKVEIDRFREVSEGIFRSGRPNEDAMRWLKDEHNVKTIINLENKDSAIRQEKRWAEREGIEFHSLPMSATENPEDATVNEALALLADTSKHPILVHCYHGRDRTGLIVGLHRVENEDWDAQKSYDEMLDMGFRSFFYKLDNYYKERTGLRDKLLSLLD